MSKHTAEQQLAAARAYERRLSVEIKSTLGVRSFDDIATRTAEPVNTEHHERGLFTVADIQAAQVAQDARRMTRAYVPESPEVIQAGIDGKERHGMRVKVERLWSDCGTAIRKWSKFAGHRDEDLIRGEMLRLLVSWPFQGGGISTKTGRPTPLIDLGGLEYVKSARIRARWAEQGTGGRRAGVSVWVSAILRMQEAGTLPLHRVWLERAEVSREELAAGGMLTDATGPLPTSVKLIRRQWQLSPSAWKALHAALNQTLKTPSVKRAIGEDLPTDSSDWDAVALADRDRRTLPTWPDADPRTVADLTGLGIDAARWLTRTVQEPATAEHRETISEWAQQWGITAASAEVSLSRGRRKIERTLGDHADAYRLVTGLFDRMQTATLAAAAINVANLAAGCGTAEDALTAAREWQEVARTLRPERRALVVALARTDPAAAAEVADTITELLRVTYTSARMPISTPALSVAPTLSAPNRLPIGGTGVRPLSARERQSDYARTAADDRATWRRISRTWRAVALWLAREIVAAA